MALAKAGRVLLTRVRTTTRAFGTHVRARKATTPIVGLLAGGVSIGLCALLTTQSDPIRAESQAAELKRVQGELKMAKPEGVTGETAFVWGSGRKGKPQRLADACDSKENYKDIALGSNAAGCFMGLVQQNGKVLVLLGDTNGNSNGEGALELPFFGQEKNNYLVSYVWSSSDPATHISFTRQHMYVVTRNKSVYTIPVEELTNPDCLPSKVSLPKTAKAVSKISCGDAHVCVLDDAGNVFTMGDNRWGQCGLGANHKMLIEIAWEETENNLASEKDEQITTTELPKRTSDETIVSFTQVRSARVGGGPVLDVAAGSQHTVFLSCDGRVFSCGSDTKFQLGQGELPQMPQKFAVRSRYGAYWGPIERYRDTPCPLTLPDAHGLPLKAVKLGAGGSHSAAVARVGDSDRYVVLTWGSGQTGQLGHPKLPHFMPPKVVNALDGWQDYDEDTQLTRWLNPIGVDCGDDHTAVLMSSGAVMVFGGNRKGQLGLGLMKRENRVRKVQPVPYLLRTFPRSGCRVQKVVANHDGTGALAWILPKGQKIVANKNKKK